MNWKTSYLLLSLTLFTFMTQAAGGMPPAQVNVAEALSIKMSPTTRVSGTVISRNNSQLSAKVKGHLSYLAEVGQVVQRGERVAQIIDEALNMEYQEQESRIRSIGHELTFLNKEVERLSSLAKVNLAATTEKDQTISQRDRKKADLAVAKKQLEQIGLRIKYLEPKAPFDGIIVERLSNLGEEVNPGTAILRFVETSGKEVTAQIPISSYQFITAGQSMTLESELGTAKANLIRLVPVADARSRLMEVRLDASDIKWPIGLNVKVNVPTGAQQEVLAVHRDALVLRRGNTSIFTVSADNKAQQVSVTTGMGSGELIQVMGDVNAGDKVVIRGAERLRPGQAVMIKASNQGLVAL